MSDWKPGEPISSRKLNQHSAARAQTEFAGPPGSVSKFGQNFGMVNHDLTNTGMWIRVTSAPVDSSVVVDGPTTQSVKLHSWEAIMWNDGLKKWQANPSNFGNATDDPNSTEAFDYDAVIAANLGNLTSTPDANLTANGVAQTGVKPYFAVRDPVSRRLIAVNPDNDSNATFKGKDVVTMILGPWTDFVNCTNACGTPVAPPPPPVAYDENCPPAYAWSGYKICGYKFKKVSTYQTISELPENPNDPVIVGLGLWATELNGQSTTSWRRFHRSWWGWDTEETSVLSGSAECAGVRFESPELPPLNCSCPPWLQALECIKLRVKYVADPGPPDDPSCMSCYEKMDGFWGTEETATLCNQQMGCVWQSNEGPAPFPSATATYVNIYDIDPCYTGPEWFDPCDPCDGFSTLAVGINDSTVASGGCGGPGNFYVGGRVSSLSALRDFVDACVAFGSPPPLRLVNIRKSGACANYVEWMELECCSCEESNLDCGTTYDCVPDAISGGNAESAFTESYFGGNATSNFTESIYGGSE